MRNIINETVGHYYIEKPLGEGGMAQVFRGRHTRLDRPVAIKILLHSLAIDPAFRARFQQEARAIAALQHQNIVEIYDFGEEEGTLYLVMELMEQGSLKSLLRTYSGQPLPLALALDLGQQIALGLASAHNKQMIHRDIKPANLLLRQVTGSEKYQLKIGDFGLAHLNDGELNTASGIFMGTPSYMSPEQCKGEELDGRSDLYALGVVLYEMMTGSRPFQISNPVDASHKHLYQVPTPPRDLCPHLPIEVEKILLRCLAKTPAERFNTGIEVAMALAEVAETPGPATLLLTSIPTTPPVTLDEQYTHALPGYDALNGQNTEQQLTYQILGNPVKLDADQQMNVPSLPHASRHLFNKIGTIPFQVAKRNAKTQQHAFSQSPSRAVPPTWRNLVVILLPLLLAAMVVGSLSGAIPLSGRAPLPPLTVQNISRNDATASSLPSNSTNPAGTPDTSGGASLSGRPATSGSPVIPATPGATGTTPSPASPTAGSSPTATAVAPVLGPPVLLSPTNGANVQLLSSVLVVFTWQTVPGAASYSFQLYASPTGGAGTNNNCVDTVPQGSPVINLLKTSTTISIVAGFHCWSVTAVDASGQPGAISPQWSLRGLSL
jgi:serine/threonine protein kinase